MNSGKFSHTVTEVITMKRWETAAALGLVLAIAAGSFSEMLHRVDALQENVLRLHILAASDSAEDQALKLEVRDALLAHSEEWFADCDSLPEMRDAVKAHSDAIRSVAQDTLQERGCTDPVSVQIVRMAFPVREYETITMPAGTYTALRILIGEGAGHNWWCVMYPPLCLPAASDASAYFDGDTAALLEEPQEYEVRLRCVEVWQELREKLSAE